MKQVLNSVDIEIENIKSEKDDADITPLRYGLSFYPADFTLEVLHQKWNNGDIIIPPFQRGFVWDIGRASRLVESVMMGLPVPPVFLFEQKDGTRMVIDGRQRLQSIFFFFSGKFVYPSGENRTFKLDGVNPDGSLYMKSYEDFDETEKRRFKDYVLRSIIVNQNDPKGDSTSMYHIFERLNTGGMTLKGQEVRNCIYGGTLNALLLKLNEYSSWRQIIGKPEKDRRQKDVEYILRYMALFHGHLSYKKPMKDFISKFMSENRNPSELFLQAEEKRFHLTCDTISECLGHRPFHPRKGINVSIFDSVFVAFARHAGSYPNDIRDRYNKLVINPEFESTTRDATTDKKIVEKRLRLADSALFG